MLNNTRVDRF